MVEETVERLGQYLKKHREEKGITLEQIEGKTKISLRYLTDIEEERFDHLPAPIFTLGFVKQYAQCIGLDPEDVALRYRLAVQQESGSSDAGSSAKLRIVRNRAFWLLVATLCGLVLLWLLLSPGSKKTQERVRSIRFPRTTLKELKKEQLRKELNIGSGSPHVLVAEGMEEGEGAGAGPSGIERKVDSVGKGPIALTLQATRRTRLKVTVDGESLQEKVLREGDRLSYQAKNRIQLEIGSGNGVRIFYGGRVYENLGRKGEVVHIVFPPPSS